MEKGILLSFEGPDGAGKTSVLKALLPLLEERYQAEVLTSREPGGVSIAEAIREVILDVTHTEMTDKTELLLYMAARRQHFVERILPALSRGSLVLLDRFVDSSVAYQGYGRGLDLADINWLNTYATDNRKPDLTLLFDVPSELGLERISSSQEREVNRLDKEALSLHQKVRKGYLALAECDFERFVVIDASQDLEKVVADSFDVICRYLEEQHGFSKLTT